jgi:hypothetical protein
VIIADKPYTVISGSGYPADSQLDVTFTGLPQPTLLQSTADFFDGRSYMIVIVWVAGVAMVTLLAFALYASRRRRLPAPALAGVPGGAPPGDADGERRRIVREIAALDERHEAGEIDDDTYAASREALKQQAMALKRPIRDA